MKRLWTILAATAILAGAGGIGWHLGWRHAAIDLLRQDEILLTHLVDHANREKDENLSLQIRASAQTRLQDRELLLAQPLSRRLSRSSYEVKQMSRAEEILHIQGAMERLKRNPEQAESTVPVKAAPSASATVR
jgi:hypothetical protein